MSCAFLPALAYLVLLALKSAMAWRSARKEPPPAGFDAAEVTVLQPILSGDPRLEAMLDTNVAALPGVNFIWLIDLDDPEARRIAGLLQERHPTARITVRLCDPVPPSTNPKLFKLALGEDEIRTRFLVVLDDDTVLPADTLAGLLQALTTHTLSTALPLSLGGPPFVTELVGQFINNQSLLTYLPWLRLHPPITINGMAYAMITGDWRARGGFSPLAHHLTDDLAVARRILDSGGTLFQSSRPVFVATTVPTFRHYCSLLHRWFVFATLLVQLQPPGWKLAILGLHGLPPVLIGWALATATLPPNRDAGLALAILLVVRSLMLAGLQRALTGAARHAPVASLVSELLQPFHLLHAVFRRTLLWRGRRIRVRAEDTFDYLP